MLKIFAKYGTDEKIAIFCHRSQYQYLKNEFNVRFGGEWILVDDCIIQEEILRFKDGMVYNGFDPLKPEDYRYSNAITKFPFKEY